MVNLLTEPFALMGKIYTSFSPLKVVSGIVVSDGKIVFAGEAEEAKRRVKELGGDILDRRKFVVMPGFIDSHMHLSSLGMSLMTLDLRGAKSIAELKARLKNFVDKDKRKVVLGRGWDQELFTEGRWPRSSDIDEVVSDVPAVLVRVCGHAAVLNSAALDILMHQGVPDDLIQKDEFGKPTGIVFEEAVGKALSLVSEGMDKKEMLKRASSEAARLGVTSVGFMSAKLSELQALKEMREFKDLNTRVLLYMDYNELSDANKSLLKVRTSLITVKGIKLFADGSFGARTALLSEPYADDQNTKGVAVMGENELAEWIKKAYELNLQTAIHAIGDAALDAVLNAFSSTGIRGKNGRVEHASIVRPDQLKKLSTLGIGAAVQPHFVISDWWLVRRLGAERAKFAYPFKTMLASGIKLGFSTDSPVEPLDPWLTVDAAVNRGEREGIELFTLTKHERLSLEDSLHCYTKGSADILNEPELGSLEEGKRADFIVLDKDPFRTEDLRSIKIIETYVEGRSVFKLNSEQDFSD